MLDHGVRFSIFSSPSPRSPVYIPDDDLLGKDPLRSFSERSSRANLFRFVHGGDSPVDLTGSIHRRRCISVSRSPISNSNSPGQLTCPRPPLFNIFSSSDFLSNLLVLLLRIRNSGLSDSGLLAHLSEATAGSLNGVGHSTAYEDVATYS